MNRSNNTPNQGNHSIGINENGDFVRVPAGPHHNIGVNEHGDFVRDPHGANETFQIFVKGTDNVTYTFDVKASYTVDHLMDMVQQKLYISKDQQKLIYAGRQLESNKFLSDYSIQKEATLTLVLRVRGG